MTEQETHLLPSRGETAIIGAPVGIPPVIQRIGIGSSANELLAYAQQFAKSGYFADAKEAAQAFVKMEYGAELGIGPAASMSGVHIVQGKPTLGASLIAACIKRSGRYDYSVVVLDNNECILDFYQNGKNVGQASFNMGEAEKARLTGKDVWRNYPSDMLFSRAITRGARRFCADVFLGPVYTPEELGANVNAEGEVIDVTPTELPKPMPAIEHLSKPKLIEQVTEYASNDQVARIYTLIEQVGSDGRFYLDQLKVDSFSQLTEARADKVIARFEQLLVEKQANPDTGELFDDDAPAPNEVSGMAVVPMPKAQPVTAHEAKAEELAGAILSDLGGPDVEAIHAEHAEKIEAKMSGGKKAVAK